jgi:anti-sigma factor RsiW
VTDEKTVSEDMLHAYVDGALSPEEAVRVDAWLASHPEDAATVAAWRHQNALIRDVFGHAGAPSTEAGVAEPVRPRRRMALAASIAIFAIGLAAGIGIGAYAPGIRPEAPTVAAQAETAYRVYSVEKRHPVEVGADEREHLVKWLSNRLETPLALPDLADEGLMLVGGRLTTTESGPAALFMFEAGDGNRYTVFVTRSGRNEETAFRFDLGSDVGGCYWRDRGIEVVVNGPADRDRLQAIANRVYEAYEGTAGG